MKVKSLSLALLGLANSLGPLKTLGSLKLLFGNQAWIPEFGAFYLTSPHLVHPLPTSELWCHFRKGEKQVVHNYYFLGAVTFLFPVEHPGQFCQEECRDEVSEEGQQECRGSGAGEGSWPRKSEVLPFRSLLCHLPFLPHRKLHQLLSSS